MHLGGGGGRMRIQNVWLRFHTLLYTQFLDKENNDEKQEISLNPKLQLTRQGDKGMLSIFKKIMGLKSPPSPSAWSLGSDYNSTGVTCIWKYFQIWAIGGVHD